jgi:radical SAM superfamily enzyme YgiQ (UPF0313 family)
MRVLLINPPIASRKRGGPLIARLFYNSMPLGLGYLAAVAEREGHTARVIDAAAELLSMEQLIARASDFVPDIIGVTGLTTSWNSTVQTLGTMRRRFPEAVLMVGGPHLSAWENEALRGLPVDAGIPGEGELAFADALRALDNGRPLESVSGLMLPGDDGSFAMRGKRRLIEDLDTLPFPARHLFKIDLYKPIPADYRGLPKIPIISSRGCPFGCVFCDKSVFGRRYRAISAERTVDEMEHCIEEHGAKGIAFLDSTFGSDRKRAAAICEEIIRRRIKTDWTCTLRADSVDEAQLRLFKQAGCWRARLGIETGDPAVLELIGKGETLEHIRRAAVAGDKAGLQLKAFFMVGHFSETPETIRRSIAFAKALPLMEVTVQLNTPMKNTVQGELWPKYGVMKTEDRLTESSFWEPVFVPFGMTKEELVKWQGRFYRSFMLRPSVLWRHIRHMRGWSDIKRYLSAAHLLFFLLFNREFGARRDPSEPT